MEERPILQVSARSKRPNGDDQRDHRAKRARYYDSDESEDEEDDLAEKFDPESYYRTNKKLTTPAFPRRFEVDGPG